MILLGLAIGLITLMSSQCNNDDPDDPASCDGYAKATSSGFINADYCFNALVHYNYEVDQSIMFSARQDGEPIYACTINVHSFTGTGTYNCGTDEPGFVELVLHGDDNEFYKSQSGTVTITQFDDLHLEASFNVTAVGYYNEETINFTGSVMKAWSK